MKINFSKFKINFRLPKKGEFKTVSIKAHHDWRITLVTFFIFAVAVVSANMLLFLKLSSGEAFVKEQEVAVTEEETSHKEIEDTFIYIRTRQNKLEELRENKPTFPDPSF